MNLSATSTHMVEMIGIRVLQQHASEVVRQVAVGEALTITDRERPAAQLVPLISSPLVDWVRESRPVLIVLTPTSPR